MTNIHQRIKVARQKAGLSQGELARLIGVTRTTVSWWESEGINATSPDGENLLKCAKHLKTTPEYLQFGEESALTASYEEKNQQFSTVNYRTYPLLYPPEVALWLAENKLPTGRIVEMIPSSTDASKNAFNIEITNDAAATVFMPNQMFFKRLTALIDPNVEPQLNSIIWAQVGNNDFRLSQYVRYGNDIYLKAFDLPYPSIKLESHMKIIGVMIGLQQDLFNSGFDKTVALG